MLKTVVDTGVPALVFFTMVVVGMELTTGDFRRIVRQPWPVVAATAGQFILLPVIGWLLVWGLGLQATIAQGVLLVAACPAGAMANVYTYLARANLALSVTLTAVSCLAGFVTMPAALAALTAVGGQVQELSGFAVPFGMLAGQLFFLLVVPVVTGMCIRRRWPDVTVRHGRVLIGFSIAALAALLGFIIVQEAEHFVGAVADIALAAGLLTVLAFAAGWATAFIASARATDRFTMGIVFVVRNVGIATAIAVTVLGRAEFAVFATAYFLSQAPLVLGAVLVYRYLGVVGRNGREGARLP